MEICNIFGVVFILGFSSFLFSATDACSTDELKIVKNCYQTYVNNLDRYGLISDEITTQTSFHDILKENCTNFEALKECLGPNVIEHCLNAKTFSQANGFGYKKSKHLHSEGYQWVAQYRLLTHLCRINDEDRATTGKCYLRTIRRIPGPLCTVPKICNELTQVLACWRWTIGTHSPCMCTEVDLERILKFAKVSFCTKLSSCSECQDSL